MKPPGLTPISLSEAVPEAWSNLALSATSWDVTLTPKQHATLALTRLGQADYHWLLESHEGAVGGAWLNLLPWDSEYFGIPMASVGFEGELDTPLIEALIEAILTCARERGIAHLRSSQRAGSHVVLRVLQSAGFQVRWLSSQITCDTRRLDTRPPPCPDGLVFRSARPEDVTELEQVIKVVGPYNWPEFEPGLDPRAKQAYPVARMGNCVAGDYADTTLVALWRGRIAGFHASGVSTHALDPKPPPFAYVRDTFVSPLVPPNIGTHLIRHALHQHISLVRQVTGRVRLDGRAMLNTALSCGYRITGDEVLLSRAL